MKKKGFLLAALGVLFAFSLAIAACSHVKTPQVEVETGGVPCGEFEITAPALQAEGVGVNPLICWTAERNAEKYVVSLCKDTSFSDIAADDEDEPFAYEIEDEAADGQPERFVAIHRHADRQKLIRAALHLRKEVRDLPSVYVDDGDVFAFGDVDRDAGARIDPIFFHSSLSDLYGSQPRPRAAAAGAYGPRVVCSFRRGV